MFDMFEFKEPFELGIINQTNENDIILNLDGLYLKALNKSLDINGNIISQKILLSSQFNINIEIEHVENYIYFKATGEWLYIDLAFKDDIELFSLFKNMPISFNALFNILSNYQQNKPTPLL